MIALTNRQTALPIDEAALTEQIERLVAAAGWKGELSVAIVDDAQIREINRHFLDHDYATDVLAFPLDDEEGEIVLSAERALAEAAERGVEPLAELMLYVVHGLLHLMGYDDHAPESAGKMHRGSLRLLRDLGFENAIPPEEWGKH